MKVVLCVVVLLTGALAAPAIDSDQINEALAEANMELSLAAVAMDSSVDKRGVCTSSEQLNVAMCWANFARTLPSKVEGMGPCQIRTLLLNEMNGCARKYGCENNTRIRNAIRTGVQRVDQNLRASGITF